MPKSEVEIKIDKATHENSVGEDWGLIMDIVDQINQYSNKKEIIKIFTRKLNDKDPHVIEHTLTLLNACVVNCDRNFRLEVCSRIFIDELKNFMIKKRFEKLNKKLVTMIEAWSKDKDIKNDPAMSLIPSLYNEIKKQTGDFGPEPSATNKNMKIDLLEKKEEEELERAIQLSLKESQSSSSLLNKPKTPNNSQSSLFGQLMQNTQAISDNFNSTANGPNGSVSTGERSSKKRKVKALYDFEAAEDNEITFKAGDVLFVSDDSDQNWWKGFNLNGDEGLFPSNFVTYDLDYQVEVYDPKSSSKKVSFNDKVNVNLIHGNANSDSLQPKKIFIDEKKIDECIEMLQNADPTGEIQPDSQELLDLEEECYMMGPLIDQKLQDIDQQHTMLEDLNLKILEAFQMYNNLMKESISKTAALISNVNPMPVPPMFNPNAHSINYAAAPPSLEANSLSFANKLNSIAGLNAGANAANQMPNQTNILSSASGTNLNATTTGVAPSAMPTNYLSNNQPSTDIPPPQNGYNTSNNGYMSANQMGAPGPMSGHPMPTYMTPQSMQQQQQQQQQQQVTSNLPPPNSYHQNPNMYMNNGMNGMGAPDPMNSLKPLNYPTNSFVN